MSKSPSNTTTTQKNEPPEFLQPYLQDAATQARDIYYGEGAQFYPGQMTVGFSQPSQDAFGMIENRARQGSDLNRAAQDQTQQTIQGNYLYGGEGFNAALDAASRRITPQVESTFARGGRLNSGLADVAKTQALSDSFASLYDAERGRQMQASALAPAMAQADYFDYNQLQGVGGQIEQQGQNLLDEDIARYNYYQQQPENRLADYIGLLNGSYPGATQSSSQPVYRNRGAGVVGGAAAGAAAGSYFGPYGTAGGAILGGLLGGYG